MIIPKNPRGPYSEEELGSFCAVWNETAVIRWLGFRLAFSGGSKAIVELSDVKPGHRGGKGSDAINGGALAAMYDFAVGCCSMIAPPLRRSATTQLSMNFERAVRGNLARCEAVIERETKHLLFVSARITDAEGNVCSRATGIVSLGVETTYDQWIEALGPRLAENGWTGR